MTVEVDIIDLANGVYQYAEQATADVIAPYLYERLRKACDMMERTYIEGHAE